VITSTWQSPDPDILAFVAEFERRGADPESDSESESESGDQFADQFVTTDPNRTAVVSRDLLVASLPQRRQMFAKAGVGPARHVRSAQLDLDARHLLLTTEWDAPRPGAAAPAPGLHVPAAPRAGRPAHPRLGQPQGHRGGAD
jgi:hypothetical protein